MCSEILTGKESRACIVRRNVFGCLSLDEDGRGGGMWCAMSRGEVRREGGEGEREGVKGEGWRERGGRGERARRRGVGGF